MLIFISIRQASVTRRLDRKLGAIRFEMAVPPAILGTKAENINIPSSVSCGDKSYYDYRAFILNGFKKGIIRADGVNMYGLVDCKVN